MQITLNDVVFECYEDDTILRAALRSGLGFPYECNVGSCGNCRYDLLDGEVENNWEQAPGLSERDRQRGRQLGCQTRPTSDCKIKVRLRDQFVSQHKPQRTWGTLAEVVDITHDIREFSFSLEHPTFFLAGQYALINVPGVDNPRAYSMSNITCNGETWSFQVKRVPDGQASNAMFTLEVGDTVPLDGPYGMAYLQEESPRDLLCVAGGSGLAPMVSIARAASEKGLLKDRKLHFFYGGRTGRDICGEAMLRALPEFGESIFYYPVISDLDSQFSHGWSGLTGFVHQAVEVHFKDELPSMEVYFAGPPVMADSLQMMLLQNAVPPAQVHFDKFV